ncbi:MAG TPA: adenylate/guanylate cyclase domain-containing protein [Geminicoccus sp.]|uniref:adenylate/guanylate cyclase domain-containing protein n=1 Tax=Geminicoccus sp. TaxID=2024832 RepID=UPI002CB8F5BA|nr:adenylate/guanylate cyclase domain-containing protein [Geminicoccus sp.]HWL68965.1 adenylate/guanylate cyclase domain-containing protein [Geminicoccus sp.]
MLAAQADRRLAAILVADVVGYARLVEADEAGTLAAIRGLRREVIVPLLASHHGRIVKLMGDGVLIEFGSVVDAVVCAVAVQRDAAARQVEIAPARRIVFRVGINLGDVVVEGDGDLLGDGVNVAARLQQLCEPGGVLISGTVYDHLQGKPDVLPLEFAGVHRVKNISRPVRTYRVVIDGGRLRRGRPVLYLIRRFRLALVLAALLALLVAGSTAAWWSWRAEPAFTAKPSIAVLPFANIGGDAATGRLADGITEDIITDLAQFPEFEVVAHNSTETYKGRAVDAREVSRSLNVNFVLEGSIQRAEDRVRITAQLIDGWNGMHLWSGRWDRPADDIFAVQTEIAQEATNRLGGGAGLIQAAGRETAKRKRPGSLSAYELYLLGTEKLEQINRADVEESIRLLTRAVELDPGLARAWIELSHAYAISGEFGSDRKAAQEAAMRAAQKAVMLDPYDAEAHAVLGSRIGDTGDLKRAEAEYAIALDLSPGSAEILTFYASWASSFGKPERGAEVADRAIRLNPNFPMWEAAPYAYSYLMVGRYEDVIRMLDRQTQDNYTRWRWAARAGAYAALGRSEEAQAAVKQALERFPDLSVERIISNPGYNDAERLRFIKVMSLAGFPRCGRAEDLAVFSKPVRLPDCVKG